MYNTSKQRNKAFLGALIGAGVGLASNLIGGLVSNNAAEKEQARQQRLQNRLDTLQMAQNLTAGYANQDYIDDLKNNIVFRCGGRKRKACGGKTRKAEDGGQFDWGSVISGVSSGINNITNSAFTANRLRNSNIISGESLANTPKLAIVRPDYIDAIDYQGRLASILRCGGKKRKR